MRNKVKIKKENKIEEFFDFQGGQIIFSLTDKDKDGMRYSFFKIEKGRYKCKSCNKNFNIGDIVIPVYWENKPSNFVCGSCRGLLEFIK